MTRVRLVLVSLVVIVFGVFAVAQQPPPQAPPAGGAAVAPGARGQAGPRGGGRGGRGGAPARKRVLAWADTRNGQAQHEFTSHALAIVERLGYESGLWDTFIRTDSDIVYNQAKKTDGTPASGGPSLSNVDGIFFLGHRELPFNDQQKKELLDWVRSGKGFVAAHTGLTALESWPEFGELIGATYGGHLYTGPGQMISESPDHPIVKHWGAAPSYNDEFYKAASFHATRSTCCCASIRPARRRPRTLRRTATPAVWTKIRPGPVFYSSLSHSTEAWDLRNLQIMISEAMKWSLGLTEAPCSRIARQARRPPRQPRRGASGRQRSSGRTTHAGKTQRRSQCSRPARGRRPARRRPRATGPRSASTQAARNSRR